jgi:TetR/AcrR family transcriptional repressor of mexJK operon
LDDLPDTAITSEPSRRERRRQAILTAARDLFIERGFDGVSLSEVVRQSGGSLSTLYELFDNKLGLLRAVVANDRFDGFGRIESIIAGDDEPPAVLRAIVAEIHAALLDPRKVGLMRVVMGESLRSPEFAQGVYADAHVPFVEQLARAFAAWDAAGKVRMPDPFVAAELFLGLILHGAQLGAMFGGPCAVVHHHREERITEAVRLFLVGYGVRP